MLSSSVGDYMDVDKFRSAVRPANNEIVVTGGGPFSAPDQGRVASALVAKNH
jgi:hypothetical protein